MFLAIISLRMKRLYTILVLLSVFLLCPGISAQAAISVSALSDFDVLGDPARLAIGPNGKVYVSDSQKHRVGIYSNNGILLDTIEGIGRPVAIDVDATGNVFVGDADTGSVMEFDAGGSFVSKLGSGDGEFIIPSGLVVTSTGDVYVADSEAGVVKGFTSGGSLFISVPGFVKPTGITVDETVSPAVLYIIDDDDGTGSAFAYRYVRVYSLGGSLLGSINLGGAFGTQKVLRPTALRVDATRLYVLDGYRSVITVMSKSGTVETSLGSLGNDFGELDVPTDLEFDTAGTLFVADYKNSRVNIYGVDKDAAISNTLVAFPSQIDFTITNRDTIPTQDVILNSPASGISWTAVSTEPWLGISLSSGVTPGSLTVSADVSTLASGTYSGQVQITTSEGILHVIDVNLTVDLQVALFVTPQSLAFEYQSGSVAYGLTYPEQTLLIYSSGESVPWQAMPSVDWVTLSSYSGTTPASVTVRLNSTADELPVDGFASFNGNITISAGNIFGSPVDIPLSLDIHEAGNVSVTTNLDEAGFTLSGPVNDTGSGKSWTFQDVPAGDYSIVFSNVDGYVRPPAQTFTLSSGETVSINGTYRPVVADTGLVAVSGQQGTQTADLVDFSGTYLGSISFLQGIIDDRDVIDFATGDLNGDGLDEVAFTDGVGKVEVYLSSGALMGELNFPGVSEVRLASADMDYDGIADLIVGVRTGSSMDIYIFGLNGFGQLVSKIVYPDLREHGGFAVAAGDIDGDGLNELVISGRDITAYKPGTGSDIQVAWRHAGSSGGMPTVSVADIDGDGTAEVISGYARSMLSGSLVTVISGDGTNLFTFDAFADLGYNGGTYVTAADIDGDFDAEIIVGAGPAESNPSVARIFERDGTFTGTTLDVLGLTSYGARVQAGRF
jgi:hypothetical protein